MTLAIKAVAIAWIALTAGTSELHITPTVQLVSRSAAIKKILAGSAKYFQRKAKLSKTETKLLKSRVGWAPEKRTAKLYVGRNADGNMVGTATLLKVDSRHGPIVLAVGFEPDGSVKRVIVTHATEESVTWVRTVIKSHFLDEFKTATSATVDEHMAPASNLRPMPRYIASVIARGVRRALVLREVAFASYGVAAASDPE
ncbi:MAG: hypothetical protein ACE5HT_04445 [Gemmatimonadales bacterium]